MKLLKFKIINEDRVGLILDICNVLVSKGINVNSLEMVSKNMHLEIESKEDIDVEVLFADIEKIPNVIKCSPIDLLPWEETNQRLQAVLDAISDGIIAINYREEITAVNPVAEKILNDSKDDLIGQKISRVLSNDIPILKSLKTGQIYNHEEIFIKKGSDKKHYVTSGRPIRDKYGSVVGVVAVVKDMTDVRRLAYSVTKPAMVTFDNIIGESRKLKSVIEMGKKVALGNSTVLLRGESGTGKELFARSIHMASFRRDQPFVPVNCAAIPDTLLESELFGYNKGAFTGSLKKGKQGLFEFANGGTIFLDEIVEISPHLQAKLLRVLQEGKVRRVGGQEEFPVDVRVIAATNKDLEDLVNKNQFRKDLYYRLNVFPIHLPPLRERKEDIPFLVDYFIKKMNKRFAKEVEIEEEALAMLYHHDWPGNIRELENVIERAVNLVTGKRLTPEVIIINPNTDWLEDDQYKENGYRGTLDDMVNRFEKQVIAKALQEYRSIRKAARALGVSHTTIMNKVKKYNL